MGRRSCRVGMALDFEAQDEIGAGLAGSSGGELVKARRWPGGDGGGERVEPDRQVAGAWVDVARGGEGIADEGVCLVAGAA